MAAQFGDQRDRAAVDARLQPIGFLSLVAARTSIPLVPPGKSAMSAPRCCKIRSRRARSRSRRSWSAATRELRLLISSGMVAPETILCHGADPTPADHAIHPRSPVGGHGIGGSRTLPDSSGGNLLRLGRPSAAPPATARIRLHPITPSSRGRPSAATALAGNIWAGSPWRAAG
jgi:hypothetical protein